MVEIGYTLSTEEHDAPTLVKNAPAAEEAGFDFLTVSDHYHPWIGAEGQSPFAWTVLGGVAAVTDRVKVAIAVTCPTIRYHPALVAQWAATAASLMEGRFELGIGSGEALNEHIYGDRWPPATVRIAMMREAIDMIRLLWKGEVTDCYGTYFIVEKARVFSLPGRCRRSSSRPRGRSREKWRAKRGTSWSCPWAIPRRSPRSWTRSKPRAGAASPV